MAWFASDYWVNKVINHTTGNGTYSAPSTLYVALLKAIPIKGTATPTNEVSGGDYQRKEVSFGSAANQRTLNDEAILFDRPTADWATKDSPVIAVAIMDAMSGGNWLWATAICPEIILEGDAKPEFDIGGIKVFADSIGGC